MRIREEIEKLESYRHLILNYEYETINKADVLSIFDKHLTDTITLTREEVRKARENWISVWDGDGLLDYTCFWAWSQTCGMNTDFCHLCKRLTEFAKEKP